VSVNCGIEPALYPGPEFVSGDLPAPCLADLLKGQGYRTIFFQSNSNAVDNFGDVVKNMGYEEFYPTESMDTEGFQVTNTFGYEDDIMRTSRRTISSTATSIAYTTWTPSCRT